MDPAELPKHRLNPAPDISWEDALHLIDLYYYRTVADYNIVHFWAARGVLMKFQVADTIGLITQSKILIENTRKGYIGARDIQPDKDMFWENEQVLKGLEIKEQQFKIYQGELGAMIKQAAEIDKAVDEAATVSSQN